MLIEEPAIFCLAKLFQNLWQFASRSKPPLLKSEISWIGAACFVREQIIWVQFKFAALLVSHWNLNASQAKKKKGANSLRIMNSYTELSPSLRKWVKLGYSWQRQGLSRNQCNQHRIVLFFGKTYIIPTFIWKPFGLRLGLVCPNALPHARNFWMICPQWSGGPAKW